MANYESIYPGATFLLDAEKNYTGFRIPAGELGATTSIQTSNQLKEVNNLLNQGIKTTEVSVIQAEVFEMIPKEMFNEINRLNKLTGAESTLHAPMLDPSGFDQQGWSEENRVSIVRQFSDIVKRAHDLNPAGNVPVTIHASTIQGSQLIPYDDKWADEAEKKLHAEKNTQDLMGRMVAIDQASGKPIFLEREMRHYPEKPGGRIYTPDEELEQANSSKWYNELSQLLYYKDRADEIIKNNAPLLKGEQEHFSPEQARALSAVKNANIYYQNAYSNLRSIFNQAYKYSDPEGEGRKELNKIYEDLRKQQERIDLAIKEKKYDELQYANDSSERIDKIISRMQQITQEHTPEQYVTVEKFVKDKASETLSEVAVNAYKEFKDNSPIISIENPPYGTAIATGQDLKDLVEKTRDKFVEKMVKQGYKKEVAEKASEKLIGVTWDTSHMSMIRKQGFDADRVTKETKIIAPFVKHVHFNDNFGSTHTDLPPGMGNLPIKDIMNELKNANYKGKKIFEGGNFFQNFQKTPFPYTLSYSGSPLYKTGNVYWNQVGGMGNYLSGHGPINPAIHHSTYGSGFSSLPIELGGEIPGASSRFSGAPNR